MTRRRLGLLAIALTWVVFATACSNDSARDEADEEQELRISLRFEPGNFDPQRTSQAQDLGIIRQLFRGLFWYDPQLELIPMAAREVPTQANGGISKDGLLYTIKLRDDLKWSDGQKITAADFEYAAKRLFDPRTSAPRAAAYFDIKGGERLNACKGCSDVELNRLREEVGVDAKDEHTLVVSLSNPRASLVSLLVDPAFYPLREDLITKHGDKWTNVENLVGNGPFVLKDRVQGERLTLAPNPKWWGTASQTRGITFTIIPDATKAFNAYIAGDLDLVEVPPDQTATVAQDPKLSKQTRQFLLLQTQLFFLNNQIPPFDNVKVRQAFGLAVDREAFVKGPLSGVGQATHSFLPPAAPGHSAKRGSQWKVNASKAKELLASGGYPGGTGLPPISFAFVPGGTTEPFGQFLKTQLKQNLGVDLQLQQMTLAEWRAAFDKKEHMILGTGWIFPPEAGSSLSEIYGCQRSEGDKCVQFPGNNVAQYVNLEADRKLQQASKEPNSKRRAALYAEAEDLIVNDAPAIFVANLGRNVLVAPRVKNLITSPLDGLFPGQHFLERAYLARE